MNPREKFVVALQDLIRAYEAARAKYRDTDEGRAYAAACDAVLAAYDEAARPVAAGYPHVSEVGCIIANGVCIRSACPNHAAPVVAQEADEPTEEMVIAGFESDAWDSLRSACDTWPYSCREAAECVRGIYKAMRAARGEGAG